MEKIISKIAAPIFLLLLSFTCMSCSKKDGSSGENHAAKGYVTGKVVDGQGNPLAGAEILLDNTLLYATYITGKTGSDGHYKIKVQPGVWKASATIKRQYNGKSYTLELTPDETAGFNDEEDAVRNFTWKLEGRRADDAYQYCGGFIQLTSDTGFPYGMEYVELVFTPGGPLIDGSAGEIIKMRMGDHYWTKHWEIEDVPIGRYIVTAFLKTTEGDYPLRIQDWVAQGNFQQHFQLDFIPDPGFTAVKNAASIVIGQ